MKKNYFYHHYSIVICSSRFKKPVLAWDAQVTHRRLTRYAAKASMLGPAVNPKLVCPAMYRN